VRKIIFCTGLTRAVKAVQKALVPAGRAQRTNQRRTHVIYTPRVPICLSLNGQQGPPLAAAQVRDSKRLVYNSKKRKSLPVSHVPVSGVGEEKFSFSGNGHLDVLAAVNILLGPVHHGNITTPA
jgi:hypothetical protein